MVIFITILFKNEYYLEHVYQYRLVLMSTVWYVFLDNYFANSSPDSLQQTFGKSVLYLVGIPIIAIGSFFSDGFRELVYQIYKPAINIYDSVGYVFAGFREPGIFKDYYTASIFYFTLFFCLIYFRTYISRTKFKVLDFLFLLILILAEIVTGRTGLYASILLLIFFILFKHKVFRFEVSFIFLSPLSILLFIFIINEINIDTINWAFESFVDSNLSTKSTAETTNTVNGFFDYLQSNLETLIIPLQPKKLGIDLPFYSDSFYIQEIIRHGAWGFFAFLFFIFKLLHHFKRQDSIIMIVLISFLFLLNIKGGNVFFMERSGIFLWTSVFFIDKIHRLRNS